MRKTCPKCKGSGSFNYGKFHIPGTKQCNECKGNGVISVKRAVKNAW